MYKPIYIFIGFHYIWNANLPIFKKIITILSIISISLGMSSMIIILSIENGFKDKFKNNILSRIPHMIITNKNQKINKFTFPKNIDKLDNIKQISEIISKKAIIQYKNIINIIEIFGIDSKNSTLIHNHSVKNILCTLYTSENHAIIGTRLAKNLNVHVNDYIQLIHLPTHKEELFNNSFVGISFKITGIFSEDDVIENVDQVLINKENALNFLKYSKSDITGWQIWLKNPFNLNIVEKIKKNFIVFSWKTQYHELFEILIIKKYITHFFLILIFLVVILNIIVNYTIHVMDQQNAIAILQAQGLPNWKITLIFIIFGLGITIIGDIIGVAISIILILQKNFLNYLISFFIDDINIPIHISISQIFFINLIFIFFTILSMLCSLYYSIKSMPFKILSHE